METAKIYCASCNEWYVEKEGDLCCHCKRLGDLRRK
jgi:hypothetical protein